MLHAKFKDHYTFCSREKIFKVFTIYGRGGHLGPSTLIIIDTQFCSPLIWKLHMKFGFDWLSGFGGPVCICSILNATFPNEISINLIRCLSLYS